MGKWEMVSFEDALDDVTKLATKIKKERYLSNGDYQIVDQGKGYIAGYSDEEEGIYSDIPVIVFGDHTRVIKYVCVPLFIGADGVKLLKVKRSDLETKFVYYYLKSRRIIDTGYNRHFKWLKEFGIPVPSLEEQQQIINTFDEINMLISLKKQQLEELDLLVKSRFVEMFGDPVTNPMGWDSKILGEYITFLTSGSRGWSQFFSEDGEMFLTIKNVKNSSISTSNVQFVHAPATKEAERTRVNEGDLLISITADLGRTGVVDSAIADYGAYINQHLSLVRLDGKRVNPQYVSRYLETDAGKMQFEAKNQVGVKSGLNFDSVKSLTIAVPPLELQNRYMDFVHQVDKSKFIIDYEANLSIMLYEILSYAL